MLTSQRNAFLTGTAFSRAGRYLPHLEEKECDFLAKGSEIESRANMGREVLRNAILIVQAQMLLMEKKFRGPKMSIT